MKGSIKQRSPGSWTICYDLPRDHNGRRRQKVVTYRGTKRDAQRELTRILHEMNEGLYVEPSEMTVAQYLERWLEDYARPNTSPKTMERYTDWVRGHLSPALGTLKLRNLMPLHIQDLYAAALARGRRDGKGGLAPQSVLHLHRVLHQALDRAVRWQLLARNPAAAVDPPRVVRRDMRILSDDEAGQLLSAAQGTRLYVPILLALTTGLRRGEVLALRWKDVDLERAVLAVTRTLEQTAERLAFKEPKTKRSRRVVTLPSTMVDVLRGHKVAQAQERLLLGLGRDETALVVSRYDGEPQNPRNFSKEFTRIARGAGLASVGFHTLRHTHATQLLASNVHPKVAQERLGHSTIATTLDIYSHVVPSMQEAAAQKTDVAIRNVINGHTENTT